LAFAQSIFGAAAGLDCAARKERRRTIENIFGSLADYIPSARHVIIVGVVMARSEDLRLRVYQLPFYNGT
jgi:hypothetical protein